MSEHPEYIYEEGTAWRIFTKEDGSRWLELKKPKLIVTVPCPFTLAKNVQRLLDEQYTQSKPESEEER